MGRSALEIRHDGDDLRDFADPLTSLSPADLAAIIISTAYRYANRPMTFVDKRIFSLIIRDLMSRGVTNVHELAWKALEQEGHTPRYVNMGEIGYIGIEAAGKAEVRSGPWS